MAKHDDGGPASGKTLLDENAQVIMVGMAANPVFCDAVRKWACGDAVLGAEEASRQAYMIAATMIAEKRRREAQSDDTRAS